MTERTMTERVRLRVEVGRSEIVTVGELVAVLAGCPLQPRVRLAVVSGYPQAITIGVNALDYSGYPDCRPEFVAAFEAAANAGTRAGTEGDGYRIRAPLIDLTKADIIRRGTELGVDYAMTVTCYDATPDGACGTCDACVLRRRGFADAGVADPTSYR